MKWLVVFLFLFSTLSKAQTITTIAGNGSGGGTHNYTGNVNGGYSGNGGPATEAKLHNPMGVAFDSHGNLYFSDMLNNVVRKVDTNGIITTYAGNGDSAGTGNIYPGLYSGDGGPATEAQLNWPWGLAIDPDDNLYIADAGNGLIRKVTPDGIIEKYIAADAYYMTIDAQGNLYYIDHGSFVRKVTPSGMTTTLAGKASNSYQGEGGPAIDANIGFCYGGIAIDNQGNLFFSSYDPGQSRILKIGTNGSISTVPGTHMNNEYAYDDAIAVDTSGVIYFSDNGSTVKKVQNGVITTIAGNGTNGSGGDGGPAIDAQLSTIRSLAFDNTGSKLALADQNNNRIRLITFVNSSQSQNNLNSIASKIENPNSGTILLEGDLNTSEDATVVIAIIDRQGHEIYEESVFAENGKLKKQVQLGEHIGDGVYLLVLRSGNKRGVSRFAIRK